MPEKLTDAFLRSLPAKDAPYKVADVGERGAGRLIVRVHPNKRKDFYYRYRIGDADRLVAIGTFDPSGKAGLTLTQARSKARDHAKTRREFGDVKAHLANEKRRKEADARRGTLGDLCLAYAADLEAKGKVSARTVKLALRLHVERAQRSLWRTQATNITADQIRDILATMVDNGRTRQVNIVRAYLSAAYAWGANADTDPRSPGKGKRFGIRGKLLSAAAGPLQRTQQLTQAIEVGVRLSFVPDPK